MAHPIARPANKMKSRAIISFLDSLGTHASGVLAGGDACVPTRSLSRPLLTSGILRRHPPQPVLVFKNLLTASNTPDHCSVAVSTMLMMAAGTRNFQPK